MSVAPGLTSRHLRAQGSTDVGSRLPVPVYLYLFTIVLPIGLQIGSLALWSYRLLLLLFIVPLAVQLLTGRYGRLLMTDLLFVAYTFWMSVALAVNNPESVVEQTGSVGVEFLGGYLMGRAYITTPQAFGALGRVLTLLIACSLPFAALEALSGRHILLEWLGTLPHLTTPTPLQTDIRMGLTRVQSTFSHPIHYGLFCSVALTLVFEGLRGSASAVRRWTSAVVVVAGTFLSLSSGPLLAVLVQCGLIGWSLLFYRSRWRWQLLIALLVLAYVVVDLLSNRTPIRVFMSYATFSPHTAFWRATINEYGMQNVWAHPILGLGLNDWARPIWMFSPSIDNFWLVTMMHYGLPAFALLAGGYAIGAWRVMRRHLDGDVGLLDARRAWIFMSVSTSLNLYTVHVWGNIYSFVFFMFGAGMWLINAQPREHSVPAGVIDQTGRLAPVYTRFAKKTFGLAGSRPAAIRAARQDAAAPSHSGGAQEAERRKLLSSGERGLRTDAAVAGAGRAAVAVRRGEKDQAEG